THLFAADVRSDVMLIILSRSFFIYYYKKTSHAYQYRALSTLNYTLVLHYATM
ncbi:hypothetical protein ACJX0J_026370, partial [Zea mays]